MTTRPVLEVDWQRTVCDALDAMGWTWNHARRSIGGKGRGWVTATTLKGWPDLVCWRGERLLFVELKRDDGRLTPEQQVVLVELQVVAAANPHVEVHVWRPKDFDRVVEVLR